MSASDKKKLRKEEKMAKLTERQQAQQKEAKKLKVSSIVFVTVIALVLCIGIGLIAYNWYASSGLPERMTKAVQLGDHTLSAAELNYYYIDKLNTLAQDWYSMYLLQQEGFQSTVALDQQQYKDEAGKTWGDYFIDEAIREASSILAMCDAAKKAGITLTAEDQTNINDTILSVETQGLSSGFGSLNDYLQAMYGNGAQEKTFRTYLENMTLAQNYYNHYTEALSYSAEDISAKDAEVPGYFSSYSYTFYKLAAEDFIEHSEETEDDEHSHTSEELAEALKQAESVANELVASGATNKEELDAAIANLPMYKTEESTSTDTAEDAGASTEGVLDGGTDIGVDASTEGNAEDAGASTEGATEIPEEDSAEDGEDAVEDEEEETVSVPTSTQYFDYDYDYISAEIAQWLAAEGRQAGQIGAVPYYALDEEGEATEEVEGYYVVILDAVDEHSEKLVSVRHILVEFEGGTEDEESGETVYSDEEKKTASDEAERIKAEYEAGEKTEDAFAALAKEYSDDNAEDGGLYEDVYPGQMVTNFEDWCYDESRKAGDVDIVETEYGYHVMYFVKTQENTYREYLITNTLRTEETEEWFTGLQDSYKSTAKILNTSYLETSLVLSN